jgi:fructose-1,6-bisphosphatase
MTTPILPVGQLQAGSTITAITEVVTPVTLDGSNVVTLNCSLGNIFFIGTAPTGGMTFNVTNVPQTINRVMTISIFVTQGSTGYTPGTFTINGTSVNPKGSSLSATNTTGKIDIFSFTLHRTASNTWNVYQVGATNF